jgi:predicted AAA+ superfamily ATPase
VFAASGTRDLFDFTEIDDAGARFENLVALHLLKLVDGWNDRGEGDYSLHYVRDKEKREVDFLIANRRRPFLLVEAKLHDVQVAPALRYFAERLSPAHTVQVVRSGVPRVSGGIRVLPADRFLALM